MSQTLTRYHGNYLAIDERDGWEYATRTNARGVAIIIPVTNERELVLVEQFRIPVNRRVLELPAGLVGDDDQDESMVSGAKRELEEETGLRAEHVQLLGATPGWLKYRLPRRYVRHHEKPLCVGQKQVWFLLSLTGSDDDLCLDGAHKPEFDHFRWVDFWYPAQNVVHFKRGVYRQALTLLEPLMMTHLCPGESDQSVA